MRKKESWVVLLDRSNSQEQVQIFKILYFKTWQKGIFKLQEKDWISVIFCSFCLQLFCVYIFRYVNNGFENERLMISTVYFLRKKISFCSCLQFLLKKTKWNICKLYNAHFILYICSLRSLAGFREMEKWSLQRTCRTAKTVMSCSATG